jgi:hypothetical protein
MERSPKVEKDEKGLYSKAEGYGDVLEGRRLWKRLSPKGESGSECYKGVGDVVTTPT